MLKSTRRRLEAAALCETGRKMSDRNVSDFEHVRVLSFHAAYQCRHAGACCTSGWPIGIEADRATRLRAAIASGAIRVSGVAVPEPAQTSDEAVLPIVDGCCAFFDARDSKHCRVHRALGHGALPLACRQFPRVVVRDPRGVSVTLSHYCPTASAMLSATTPVQIAMDAPGFPPRGEYEGLDARGCLPPLLRPDMLMDWAAWWELEGRAVEWLADSARPSSLALAGLWMVVEHSRTWTPADGPLIERVRAGFDAAGSRYPAGGAGSVPPVRREVIEARCHDVLASVPAEHARRSPSASSEPPVSQTVLRNFLAAHAFANWTIHLGQGLRTWVQSVEAAYALILSGRSVRQADLLLRHLSDPKALALRLSRSEHHASLPLSAISPS